MKLNKTIKVSKTLFELQIIKSQVYNKNFNKRGVFSKIECSMRSLKKALQLIFKYCQFKKQILIIGIDEKLKEKALNFTKFNSNVQVLSSTCNLNSSISTSGICQNKNAFFTANIPARDFDLIIVLKTQNLSNYRALAGFVKKGIPIIAFSEINSDIPITYKINLGNSKNNTSDNLLLWVTDMLFNRKY